MKDTKFWILTTNKRGVKGWRNSGAMAFNRLRYQIYNKAASARRIRLPINIAMNYTQFAELASQSQDPIRTEWIRLLASQNHYIQ